MHKCLGSLLLCSTLLTHLPAFAAEETRRPESVETERRRENERTLVNEEERRRREESERRRVAFDRQNQENGAEYRF